MIGKQTVRFKGMIILMKNIIGFTVIHLLYEIKIKGFIVYILNV